MRVLIICAGLLCIAAGPGTLPRGDQMARGTCAAVIFTDSGLIALSSGKASCEEAANDAVAICESNEDRFPGQCAKVNIVKNQWAQIFRCESARRNTGDIFITAHPEKDVLPRQQEEVRAQYKYDGDECKDLKIFHSSEWY